VVNQLNRENRMRLPVKLKVEPSTAKGEEKSEEPRSSEEMWDRLVKTLERNINMVGAARATKEFMGVSPEEKAQKEPQSAVRPVQELVEAAKLFGVDIGALMDRMSQEAKALREATDAKEREIHELRLKELTQMEQRIKDTAAEMAKVRESGNERKGLGGILGLEGLDPDVKRRIEERVFGLVEPERRPSEDSRQPAPFTKEWFDQWGEMKPGIEALARMLGYVPREEVERERGNNQQPLVSMSDVTSGKVPVDVVLGIRRLELENERERLRIEREDERARERNRILAGLRETIDKNAPDAIAAVRDLAGQHNREAEIKGAQAPEALEQPRVKGIRCSECGYEFLVSQELESYHCPSCGARLESPVQQQEVPLEE